MEFLITKSKLAALTAAFFSLLCTPAWPTELEPWLSDIYLPIVRGNFTYLVFHQVDTASGLQTYKAYNEFLDRSLQMTVKENINVEAEWGGCSTRETDWEIEYIRTTGRYLILNDVGGEDPVSLTAGVTLTFPWRQRLEDISLMHHSLYDAEFHIAVGKEIPCGPTWSERFWGLLGYGQGTRGKGWIHAIAAAEKNFHDIHRFRLSFEFIRGLGKGDITDLDLFPGYASIAHQSLDASLKYTFSIPTYFDLSLEYTHRLSSMNCPYGVNAGTIGLIWPLSFLAEKWP